jgi:ZIP family zinc transporter
VEGTIGLAFLLTAVAGVSTGIGSFVALLSDQGGRKFLALSLGFSAGVMIYISMAEILVQGQRTLTEALGRRATDGRRRWPFQGHRRDRPHR